MKDRQKYSGVIKSTFTVLKDNSLECFKVNVTYFTLKIFYGTTMGQTKNLPKMDVLGKDHVIVTFNSRIQNL